METAMDLILRKIGNDYGCPEEQITPIIQKLNKEFFFKLKDFKNLNSQKWKEYDLPDNLFHLLEEKYKQEEKKGKYSMIIQSRFQILGTYSPQKKPAENNSPKTPRLYQNTSTEYANPEEAHRQQSEQALKEKIDEGLSKIDKEIQNFATAKEVLKLLEGVVNNILIHQHDEKFKKVNIEKVLKRYPFKSIENFLTIIEFKRVEHSPFMKFQKEPNWLKNVNPMMYQHYGLKTNQTMNVLKGSLKSGTLISGWIKEASKKEDEIQRKSTNQSIRKTGTKGSSDPALQTFYNPTPSVSNNNAEKNQTSPKEKEGPAFLSKYKQTQEQKNPGEPKMYTNRGEGETVKGSLTQSTVKQKSILDYKKEEQERREKIIQRYKPQRQIKCYYFTNISKLSSKLTETQNIVEYFSSDSESKEMENKIRQLQANQNTVNKEETIELIQWMRSPIFVGADFYFSFPDKFVLKATFGLKETVSSLYEFVKYYIHNPREKFYLSITNRKIESSNKKIGSMDFKFPVVFDVVFPIIYCKLNNEELNKLTVDVV